MTVVTGTASSPGSPFPGKSHLPEGDGHDDHSGDRIVQTRAEQDNEQWHLLILQDLAQRRGVRQSFIKHRPAPWLIAFVYYHLSWLLFLVAPEWSYRLNADFEDHADALGSGAQLVWSRPLPVRPAKSSA